MMNNQYDLWLNWKVTHQCNLTCQYCCASFSRDFDRVSGVKKLRVILGEINSKKGTLLKIGLGNHWRAFKRLVWGRSGKAPALRTDALMAVLDRLGKTCKIVFTGGEPLLVKNIVEAARVLTEKHYVGFITNLTLSARLRQLYDTVPPDRVAELTASLHVEELERRGLVETFIANCLAGRAAGFDVAVVAVAYPPLFSKVLHYKKLLADRGITLQVTSFIGKHEGRAYPAAYTEEEIAALGLGPRHDDLMVQCFGRPCNAGHNAFAVFPDGSVQRCFTVSEGMGNVYEEVRPHDAPRPCPVKYCKCAMWAFDEALYQKAMETSEQPA